MNGPLPPCRRGSQPGKAKTRYTRTPSYQGESLKLVTHVWVSGSHHSWSCGEPGCWPQPCSVCKHGHEGDISPTPGLCQVQGERWEEAGYLASCGHRTSGANKMAGKVKEQRVSLTLLPRACTFSTPPPPTCPRSSPSGSLACSLQLLLAHECLIS